MSRLRLFLTSAATVLVAIAAAQAPFKAAPGTDMVKTTDFGELPREIIWNKDGAPMVLVPAGASKLGRGAKGDASVGNEGPEIEIELPSFYIDKFEVSNKQFEEFVNITGGTPTSALKSSGLTAPELPVVAVLQASAIEYAKWARKELPTEAMWEKAARGPASNLFTTGEAADFSKFVMGKGANGPSVATTTDTGDISGYGAHHMTGNVREWVIDHYERDAYSKASRNNPKGAGSGDLRSTRGGSYFSEAKIENARLTRREAAVPTQTRDDLGFRTVFVLRPAPKATPMPSPSPTPPPFDPKEDLDNAFKRLNEDWQKAASRPEWRAPVAAGGEEAEVANLTPYPLRATFVTIDGTVTIGDTMLDPYSFSVLKIPFFDPSLRTFLALGPMDQNGITTKAVNAGEISAAQQLTAVIESSVLSDIYGFDGKKITDAPTETVQFYDSSYQPQWDEIEFLNKAELPIEVSLTEIDSALHPVGEPISMTIPPGAIFSGKLKPTTWEARVSYVGSKEAAASAWTFKVDPSAARRLIAYLPDTIRQERVLVFAKKVPFLTVDVLEAKRLTGTAAATKK